MTFSEVANRIALLGAALTAVAMTRAAPAHRPVSVALVMWWVCDSARGILFFLDTGLLARRALFLAFPIGSAWLTGVALLGAAARSIHAHAWALSCACMWLCGVAVFVHVDPPRGSPDAELLAFTARIAGLVVETLVVLIFALKKKRPSFTQAVVLALAAGDVGELLGPWFWPSAWAAWDLAQGQWAVVYTATMVVHHSRLRWLRSLQFSAK